MLLICFCLETRKRVHLYYQRSIVYACGEHKTHKCVAWLWLSPHNKNWMPTKLNAQVKFRRFSQCWIDYSPASRATYPGLAAPCHRASSTHAKNNKSHKIYAGRVSLCEVKKMNHINSIMHAPLYPNILPGRVVCFTEMLRHNISYARIASELRVHAHYSNIFVLSVFVSVCDCASLRFVAQQPMNVPHSLYRRVVAKKNEKEEKETESKKKKKNENSKQWRKLWKKRNEAIDKNNSGHGIFVRYTAATRGCCCCCRCQRPRSPIHL